MEQAVPQHRPRRQASALAIRKRPPRVAVERRSQPRHVARLRVALLHGDNFEDIRVVKNLSENGLSARLYRKLAMGKRVSVEFRSGQLLTGFVMWKGDCEIGLALPEPIDVAAVLASRWATEASRRRALPRIAVTCPGRLSDGIRTFDIVLNDISQGGAHVQGEIPVGMMANVVLQLPDLPLVGGVVRWTRPDAAGISFNECFAFEPLARWIQARRELDLASAR